MNGLIPIYQRQLHISSLIPILIFWGGEQQIRSNYLHPQRYVRRRKSSAHSGEGKKMEAQMAVSECDFDGAL